MDRIIGFTWKTPNKYPVNKLTSCRNFSYNSNQHLITFLTFGNFNIVLQPSNHFKSVLGIATLNLV